MSLRDRRKEIRADLKKVLAALDRRWIEAASGELCQHLTEFLDTFQSSTIRNVLGWIPYFPGEVDLQAFLGVAIERDKKLYLPRVLETQQMRFVAVSNQWRDETERGLNGLPVPKEDPDASFNSAWAAETLVLVPGIAFDASGNRLGRGSGHYDRFLAGAMQRSLKVGVCWSIQIQQEIPTEWNDIAMDFICDETGVRSCHQPQEESAR